MTLDEPGQSEATMEAPTISATPAVTAVPPAGSKRPKWEADARERVKVGIRKFSKPLADFVARDVNEADTRLLITDFLCEVLGYDKYSDVTAEFAIKGDFADYGLRIDKQLVALIEAKRATTKLSPKHLRQIEDYGVREGVDWLILTNGSHWQVYRLGRTVPIVVDLAIEVDLLGPDQPAKKAEHLFPITRDAIKHGVLEEVWKAKRATSPKAIARVLISPAVVTAVRKELRRETDYSATDEEILGLVKATLRPDCE
jgi:phage anti-repressor protein